MDDRKRKISTTKDLHLKFTAVWQWTAITLAAVSQTAHPDCLDYLQDLGGPGVPDQQILRLSI